MNTPNNDPKSPNLYPVMLDLRGRRVLVVGLGAVGRRKVRALVAAGAEVSGVDPLGWDGAPPGTVVLREPYRPDHLAGARLVIAAAPPEVNARVVADCSARNLWVDAAAGNAGDVLLPAVGRSGGLIVAVSTSGAGPAAAAALRDRVMQALGPAAGEFCLLLAELRAEAKRRIADPLARRRLLKSWADPAWLERFTTLGREAVARALRDQIDQAAAGPP